MADPFPPIAGTAASLRLLPPRTRLALRCDPALLPAVGGAFGAAPPATPLASAVAGGPPPPPRCRAPRQPRRRLPPPPRLRGLRPRRRGAAERGLPARPGRRRLPGG